VNASTVKSILCVDDEPSVLTALKRNFRQESFNVITTTSPYEALDLLAEQNFAAVISDYRMPKILGTDLLSEVRQLQPDTSRILLTGQADLNGVIAAVNEGGIHKFFLKPWDNLTLSFAIRECVELFALKQKNQQLTKELAAANQGLSALNQDLTSQLQSTANRLDEKLYYDEVTGLPNEKLLIKTLDKNLSHSNQSMEKLVIIAIAIIDFSALKSILGKEQSDQLIRQVAVKLRNHLRVQDVIARVSDNSFCIGTRTNSTRAELEGFAGRLILAGLEYDADPAQQAYLNLCASISYFGYECDSSEVLLENSLTALNEAKRSNDSAIVFYDRQLRVVANERQSLTNDLYQAVKNKEFFLHFQPRVDAKSGIILAAEVLLRWDHPTMGLISPADFIPILEETGLIESVGQWVIRETCKFSNRLGDHGKQLILAVNVSPIELDSESFFDSLVDSLSLTNLKASQFFELEITETMLISDEGIALNLIYKLKELGIKIAIDDFGTGYSSLSYLAEIPADYLKIDQSFIRTLETKPKTRSIVESIISIANALHLCVIAEGIETIEQADLLRTMGCHQMQGYFYSRPVDEASLLKLLDAETLPIEESVV
jgi:diguanylate cyclase (GGDEF)-like protein